jgi:hypothetical protein
VNNESRSLPFPRAVVTNSPCCNLLFLVWFTDTFGMGLMVVRLFGCFIRSLIRCFQRRRRGSLFILKSMQNKLMKSIPGSTTPSITGTRPQITIPFPVPFHLPHLPFIPNTPPLSNKVISNIYNLNPQYLNPSPSKSSVTSTNFPSY